MTEAIIVALITGSITLIGNVLALWASSKKTQADMKTKLAVMEAKMDNLAEEVRIHNDFGRRIPVLEAKVEALEKKSA